MNESNIGKYLVTFLVGAMLAVGAGCGNDENKNGVIGGDPPDAITDVDQVVFLQVSLDTTDVQTLTIFNVGKGDLRIDNVKLVEETTGDPGGEEFKPGDDWVKSAVLATDEELRLSVEYTPTDKEPDSGYIELVTNDPKFDQGILRVPLRTPEIAPRITHKNNVIFRRVPPVDESTRDKFWQLSEVQNVGQAPLDITDIVINPAETSDFSVSYPETTDPEADPADDSDTPPSSLEPGDTAPLRIYFNPEDDLPSEAELIFFSNDPESPEYVVSLLGNSGSPCLQLNHEDEINFGEGGIGFANNKTIIIENCSPSSELRVSAISVCTFVDDDNCTSDDPTFEVKEGSLPGDLPGDDAVIGPQDTASMVLTYTPEDLEVSTGEFTVRSDDPAKSTLTVPVIGKGTDNQCPQALAEARLSDSNRWETEINTIPLKTIQFRGTNSLDNDGSIARYEWNIIKKPSNSTARFTPSATVEEPQLFLDLAGDYEIELKVFDDKGTESCGDQAIVLIRATPDEDIHVQLVWDTPTDTDQDDTDGTDLDLHFLHPNGAWNNLPWDVFWNNAEAEWGAPGPDDNPSLDIDDTDGAGPENVNLNNPENGITYAVGVYYYAANGYGPSYATTRIFIRGTQEFEWRDMYLPDRQSFWYVATITWPSAEIFAVNQVQQGFPSRP